MSVDIDALQFYSGYPIDKIIETNTVSIVNNGATNQAPQTANITTDTFPNSYGKQCFVRFVWSIDNGANFNSSTSHLVYTFTYNTVAPLPVTSSTLSGLQAAVSIGVSNNNVTVLTGNGYHGTVTDNGTTYTYTPISQTFIIKYALFSID